MDDLTRAERRERVLDLWSGFVDVNVIAEAVTEEFGPKATAYTVRGIVQKARDEKGDPRAIYRTTAGGTEGVDTQQAIEAEIAAIAAERDWSRDTYEPAVPLAPVKFRGEADSLRPMRMSVERRQSTPSTSLTASLMGDPPPERSALGRECRPDEYASKGGEGRYRDNARGFALYVRRGSHIGVAGRLARDRVHEMGVGSDRGPGVPLRSRKNLIENPQRRGKEG